MSVRSYSSFGSVFALTRGAEVSPLTPSLAAHCGVRPVGILIQRGFRLYPRVGCWGHASMFE